MIIPAPDTANDGNFYRKKLLLSSVIPGIFVVLMWLVRIIELLLESDFSRAGIYPLEMKGLTGILLSPFIHADFRHLLNNSIPLFFLMVALFYFYSEKAFSIFFLNWIMTGLLVWIAGREAWHIGASGLVYGLASFHFFSGIIRRHLRLVALSMLIVFLYGSMVWGMFPDVYKNVSWESHMLGFFSGIILAIWFRNTGPQAPVIDWNEEDDNETDDEVMEQEEEKKEGSGN